MRIPKQINKISNFVTTQTFRMMLIDSIIIIISYYLAYYLRYDANIPQNSLAFLFNSLPMVLLVKLYFIRDLQLYNVDLKYTSITEITSLFKATLISEVSIVVVIWASGLIYKLPRPIIFIDWSFSFLLLGAVRTFPRIMKEGFSFPVSTYLPHLFLFKSHKECGNQINADNRRKNVLIYGAGNAGQMIVREIKSNSHLPYNPVAFIDDNPEKHGKLIHGIKVSGGKDYLKTSIKNGDIDEIIIAIPTVHRKSLNEVIRLCEETGKPIRIVPGISELVGGKISISQVRNVRVEDLLGREPVKLNIESISGYLENKTVLVTGAGGSIGSELCRQIIKYNPNNLLLFGRGEHSIFNIHDELRSKYTDTVFPQILGDVINRCKVEKVCALYRPDIVFHAAADKHVTLMEMNPDEAVLNNIIGTLNVIQVAEKYKVEKLICISTDKAVNPTSVMGACKRIAEKLIQSRNSAKTKVMGVRFGNVLGSRGSVIPLFEKQIKKGGPVTITHKDMQRFLMTIPEAAQLVIQAGAIGENGDLFVLDMGDQVKIDDFARTMIKLAGFKPDEEIEVVYTGIRPGEKLYEELLYPSELHQKTSHPKIIRIIKNGREQDLAKLMQDVQNLKQLSIDMDYDAIYRKLAEIVREYQRSIPSQNLASFSGGGLC
jgi:FlaA1/EpsC-like NDP-sugar epimerase